MNAMPTFPDRIIHVQREQDTLEAARQLGTATTTAIAQRAGYPNDADHLAILKRLCRLRWLSREGETWLYLPGQD